MTTRQLPQIPEAIVATFQHINTSQVRGNVSDDAKRFSMGAFKYFMGAPGSSHGTDIGHRIKMLEVNAWGVDNAGDGPPRAETILEIEVEKDMCNIFGIMHGACAAYIIDQCSTSSLVVLGYELGVDGIGVSQSMNITWNKGARPGARLKIVGTSMFIRGRVRAARCDIWDGDTLCVSAVHTLVNPWKRHSSSESPVARSIPQSKGKL